MEIDEETKCKLDGFVDELHSRMREAIPGFKSSDEDHEIYCRNKVSQYAGVIGLLNESLGTDYTTWPTNEPQG